MSFSISRRNRTYSFDLLT